VAQTREEAIAKMRRALREFVIEGIKTTVPFHRQLLKSDGFVNGDYTTKYMDDFELK
jgi:acetyl-CoA carboxylase biotin carboxylase subunit